MLATKVIERVLVAAVLFGLAATVIAVDLSKNVDCVSDEDTFEEWGVVFGAALAGLGALALTWMRRWRWLYAAGVSVLVFVPVSAQELLMAVGKCAN